MSMNKTIGGILLVTGTTIGAAMLALPVITGPAGFYPSLFLFVFYWALLTYSAFLLLEVTLWMEINTNIISMAKETLGRFGEACAWISYLFLLYALTTAYLSGGASIFSDFVFSLTGYLMPEWLLPVPLLIVFGYFVHRGAHSVDRINRLLMFGLACTYCIIMVVLFPHIDKKLLDHADYRYLVISSSVIVTSFGFHIIIPTLSHYLQRDVKKLRTVLLIGSVIPLLVYIVWNAVALGIIPLAGKYGIFEGYHEGRNGIHLLTGVLGSSTISTIARFFSFFAIITSFLGVSLSMTDFLSDGLKIEKKGRGELLLSFITFFPPLIIMWFNPRAFLTALEWAGAFGVIILLVFLPALMVYKGRYSKNFKGSYQAPGGKGTLIFVMVLAFINVLLEILNKLGLAEVIIKG